LGIECRQGDKGVKDQAEEPPPSESCCRSLLCYSVFRKTGSGRTSLLAESFPVLLALSSNVPVDVNFPGAEDMRADVPRHTPHHCISPIAVLK